MVENLKRLREPVAWIVLAVTAGSIVLALIRFGVALSTGLPFAEASQSLGLTVMNLTLVVLVVALVWTCVFVEPASPRAPRLVTLSAIVVTLGTLLTLLGAILGLSAIEGVLAIVLEFVGGLLDIVVKAVGAVILWLIHRGVRAGRIAVPVSTSSTGEVSTGSTGGVSTGSTGEGSTGDGPSNEVASTWTPDVASGHVWTSASDAASGAPASGSGRPGSGNGWHPVSREVDDSAEGSGPPGLTKG